MLAYNLNCWLVLFQREETAKVAELKHTTLAIARLRFLFWRPRSGGTPDGWGSATAISMRREDCFSN
jgi:hypothetical protein